MARFRRSSGRLEDGFVRQIGVTGCYQGKLQNGIGLGSTIKDVERAFGAEVFEDEDDNLAVTRAPGWCFDTQEWGGDHTLNHNRSALLTAIFVYSLK